LARRDPWWRVGRGRLRAVDEPTAGRGEGFIEQIRARYPAELAEQIIARVRRRDAHEHAENAVDEATFWLGAELGVAATSNRTSGRLTFC
jgi:hypothetical protein